MYVLNSLHAWLLQALISMCHDRILQLCSFCVFCVCVCVCQFSAQCRGTCRSCVLMQMLACASRGRSGGIKRRAWQVSLHDKNVLQLSRSNHNVAYMVTVCDLFLLSKEFWSLLVISVSLLSSCFFFSLVFTDRPSAFSVARSSSTFGLWLARRIYGWNERRREEERLGCFTDVNFSPGQAFPVIRSLLHSCPCGWLRLFVSLPRARGAPSLAGGRAFFSINWVSLH